MVNTVKNQIAGTPGAEPTKFIDTKVESIPGTSSFTQFDFLAPGMIVFAILLLATTVAAILTREVESGTLERLKMSKMRSFDLLFGGLIPWSLIAGAQVVILLIVAIISRVTLARKFLLNYHCNIHRNNRGNCINCTGNDNSIIC